MEPEAPPPPAPPLPEKPKELPSQYQFNPDARIEPLTAPWPPPAPVKKERWYGAGQRTVRVGKWTSKPSKEAKEYVSTFLTKFFKTEKVWHRLEHGSYVVSVKENVKNTQEIEEFRFNRTMEQRFKFNEVGDHVEVELQPL